MYPVPRDRGGGRGRSRAAGNGSGNRTTRAGSPALGSIRARRDDEPGSSSPRRCATAAIITYHESSDWIRDASERSKRQGSDSVALLVQ